MKNIWINGGPGTGKTIISRAMTYYIGHEGLDVEETYLRDIHADIDAIETLVESGVYPESSFDDLRRCRLWNSYFSKWEPFHAVCRKED